MNQVEMIKELSKRVGITQAQAMKALKEVIAIVRGEIQAEGRMYIADLGTFTLRERKAMKMKARGVFPAYSIPAFKTVHFQVSAGFKRALNLK